MKKISLFFTVAGLLTFGMSGISQGSKMKGTMHGNSGHFKLASGLTENVDYLKGHIIFQVGDGLRSKCTNGYIDDQKLNQMLTVLGATNLSKLYPSHLPPSSKANKLGQAYADLSLIYEVTFQNNIPLEKAINMLLSTGSLNFADPRYVYKMSVFIPNDPNCQTAQPQYSYLNIIKAFNAWDTTDPLVGPKGQGDTNVVIGIVDSGSDLAHPDLMSQFKHNWADTIDGIDNDADGYIDNFTGWDLAGADYNNIVGDNNPQIMGSNNMHGSHVSGCAGAATNNGIGVAGVGFKCKLLPVKCAADNDTRSGGEGYIITGYEGITYAADHGAKVINCSWGGTAGGSYGQTIITYAAINKNALVCAAAGNNAVNQDFYPASFTYVLSVAASNNNNDQKASFSNFGFNVDITSPGNNIYNTVYNQTYTYLSGTSMASPITSGGAALVLSKWPSYTGLQAGQRLKVTSDNINSVNPSYMYELGDGRMNLYRALTDPTGPSVVFANQLVSDHNDMVFNSGDTLFISGDFINYLNPTTSACNAVISIYGTNTFVSPINTTFNIGVLGTNVSKPDSLQPFTYKVNNPLLNASVIFEVKVTDGSYSETYYLTVLLNPDYVNININDIGTTITTKGKIGWNQDGATGGLGFTYMGDEILYEAGLMVGGNSSYVSDCVRGMSSGASDADFASVVTAHAYGPYVSNDDVTNTVNDNPASPGTYGVQVRQNAYAWTAPGCAKFVISEYHLVNNSSTTLSNFWIGIFADWDIDAASYASNKSDYDFTRKMGYSWATISPGYFAGIRLLTNTGGANFYGIDNAGTGRGGINLTTTFSEADKFTTLSTFRQKAGDSSLTTYPGNDVCNVMSSGPFTIAPGDSVKVAFALLAGDNLTQLQTSSDTAFVRYNNIPINAGLSTKSLGSLRVFPNPATGTLNLIFDNRNAGEKYNLSLFNVMGQLMKSGVITPAGLGLNQQQIDVSNLPSGTYLYKIQGSEGETSLGKVMLQNQ